MGLAQIYAGMTANGGHLNIERLPFTGLIKTYSASDYITDSGAGATAFSAGVKTYNTAIGVGTDSLPRITILEIAGQQGLSTGLIATSSITHATPAAFAAHEINRENYEEIAADFLNSGIDLFIGGGRDNFEKRHDGINLTDSLRAKGFSIAYDTNELKQIHSLKLAALLAGEHLPPREQGRMNMLPLSVSKALELLSSNKKGFFLMVEGSQIDWAGHDNDAGNLVSEMIDFDKAIGRALDFAAENGNTLVVVTADHETGGVALTGGDFGKKRVDLVFSTKGHTGIMVPVFAYGPGAGKFTGIFENTGIFTKMSDAFGFTVLE